MIDVYAVREENHRSLLKLVAEIDDRTPLRLAGALEQIAKRRQSAHVFLPTATGEAEFHDFYFEPSTKLELKPISASSPNIDKARPSWWDDTMPDHRNHESRTHNRAKAWLCKRVGNPSRWPISNGSNVMKVRHGRPSHRLRRERAR